MISRNNTSILSETREINSCSQDLERKIIPLSPVESYSDLNEITQTDYQVYRDYLNEALENPRISNIAVSGNFGVGKSSILRVFENEQIYRTRWLHISMGNFRKASTAIEMQKKQSMSERTKYKQDLEIDLLRQITAECKPEEIPRTSFKLVPSQETKREKATKYIVPIVMIITVALLFLAFGDSFSDTVRNILFLVLAGIVSFGVGWLTYCLLPKFRLNQFALKTEYAEVSAEKIHSESYLEQHCFELVYVLETLARKDKNCTVVFEDMDRLDVDLCVDIFSKLREINYLVNRRLKNSNFRLKFIYVVHDMIMSHMKMEKFFDYIMPIVPVNSKRNLCCNNCSIKIKDILEKKFCNINDENILKMIEIVCTGLTDFRMIYTCINDYRVFRDIGQKHGNSNIEEQILDPNLFAFMVYKNLRPEEYYDICRTGALPTDWLEKLPQEHKFLFKLSQSGFLTEDCLHYIGC